MIKHIFTKGDGAAMERYAAFTASQFSNASSVFGELRIRMLSVLLSILILVLVPVHRRIAFSERS